MNPWQAMVEAFHHGTNSTIGDSIELRDPELRARLILEEAVETVAAMGFAVQAEILTPNEDWLGDQLAHFAKQYETPNLEDAIDGLADLIYVVLGSAVAWGIDLDPFFAEVQRANMDKLQGPKRADGKQLKPEGWRPPDIRGVLAIERERDTEWKDLRTRTMTR